MKKEIYAWDNSENNFLLIHWISDGNGWSWDRFGDIDTTPYPYVVNGAYKMSHDPETNKIFIKNQDGDKMWASYVCLAPDGDGYNDIIEKATMQKMLFAPREMTS